jgi:hypothetical protein
LNFDPIVVLKVTLILGGPKENMNLPYNTTKNWTNSNIAYNANKDWSTKMLKSLNWWRL